MCKSINSLSKHFVLHQLGAGIFTAIAENGGQAVSNSGLIDLGGQIMVFDTFVSPQAARDLHRFAIDQFGRAPHIVINSHYHNDHIWGNQVFIDDALVISSTGTRDLITTEGQKEFQWYSSHSVERLESIRSQYLASTDEQEKQELLLWMGEYGGIVEALPHLKVCLPSVTFEHNLEIHGTKQTARLITFQGGHTGSDTVLYLPQEGIIFMSDLLFTNFHPYLHEGDPLMSLQALRAIDQLDATCYIPGHGPIGTRRDLAMLMGYIEHCMQAAQDLVNTGDVDEEKVGALVIPKEYQPWQLSRFYRGNILSFCRRLGATGKS